jgi:carboxylesterase type B
VVILLKSLIFKNFIGISASILILLLFLLFVNEVLSSETTDSEVKEESIINKANTEIAKPECTAPVVEINQGKLCGKSEETSSGKHVNAYLGIPFAESTAGKNRWRAPIPDQGWEGFYKATSFGPACPQSNRFDPSLPYSEDCLSVNVWAPAEKSEKPSSVMLFIYGGAYLYGYSGDPVYNAAYTSANGDVVVVSMNYRVASLGFLSGIKDKKTGEEINGNFGLLDQLLAMKWVKDNISKFGGDPNQIALYGQSAGAASVAIHLTGPSSSKELFNYTIMESGPLGLPYKTIEESKPIAKEFAKNLGCGVDDLACMRSKSAKEVVEAQDIKDRVMQTALHGIRDFLIWAPVIDGEIVSAHPLTEIAKNKINKPLIIGTNKNEGLTFVAFSMNKLDMKHLNGIEYSLALDVIFRSYKLKNEVLKQYPPQDGNNERMLGKVLTDYLFTCPSLFLADNSSVKTWVYLFDHVPSFNVLKLIGLNICGDAVCHGSELPFVFHTAEHIGFDFTEEERLLSGLMVNYWANFAKNVNPNGNTPQWPEYKSSSSNVILVTPIDEIESKKDLKAKCDFWDKVGYDLHTSFWDIL